MSNLFKKVAVMTDIHFGLKSNSVTHNQDCEDFVDWFIATAKAENCDTGIFCGDYQHNRNTMNISTMHYSLRALEKLGKSFDQFFFITGNHDLYYKDKRDIHSAAFGKYIPGITVVDSIITLGDVTIMPWLVGDEWKKIPNIKSRYMFGHLELPSFFMNAMVQMPDHGQLQSTHFKHQEHVFTGHFHKRQHNRNISYIGNAFPHNYADAGDDDRGMMILEWGNSPVYKSWPNQPLYRVFKLSDLIDNADSLLREKMHCRVTIDLPISFEEANFIRETFLPQYNLRELMLIPEKVEVESSATSIDVTFESVDTIVMAQLAAIESEAYDNKLLLEIYKDL